MPSTFQVPAIVSICGCLSMCGANVNRWGLLIDFFETFMYNYCFIDASCLWNFSLVHEIIHLLVVEGFVKKKMLLFGSRYRSSPCCSVVVRICCTDMNMTPIIPWHWYLGEALQTGVLNVVDAVAYVAAHGGKAVYIWYSPHPSMTGVTCCRLPLLKLLVAHMSSQ